MAYVKSPDAITDTGGLALTGVIGSLILPVVGYGSIAVAAGSLGLVATVCATGGAILFIPHWILYHDAIDQSFKRYEPAFDDDGHPLFDENHERVQVAVIDRPIAHFCLLTVLNVGTIIGSIMIGAAIFAAFANPIGLCVLAGTITALVAAAAIVFLYGLCFGGVAAVAAAENQQGGGLAAMGYRNRYDDGEGDEDIAQARLNPQLNQHGLFREQGDGPIHVVDDVRIRRRNGRGNDAV